MHAYTPITTHLADATIRIRGGSSINKSNDPLILVDGVERAFSVLTQMTLNLLKF